VIAMTEAPPPTTRETWADWFPGIEPTLTIEDVVDQVRNLGVEGASEVTADKVRYWQRAGVLPAPIRRKPKNGTRARALYPPQAMNAVMLIAAMRHGGVPLRQLNDLVTRSLKDMAKRQDQDPKLSDAVTTAAANEGRRVGSPIRGVEVTFTDARNRKHSHIFTITDYHNDDM
jgi:DNA-binding transcriptional MerR regulator